MGSSQISDQTHVFQILYQWATGKSLYYFYKWRVQGYDASGMAGSRVSNNVFTSLYLSSAFFWFDVASSTKSRTRLNNFTFTFHFRALEKEMAAHSSVLAWRIPGMEEPRGLPSLGLHRVRHDWSDLAAAASNLFFKTFSLSWQTASPVLLALRFSWGMAILLASEIKFLTLTLFDPSLEHSLGASRWDIVIGLIWYRATPRN